MGLFKCKCCGGELAPLDDEKIAICEYCGSKQTLPQTEDEKVLKMFARGSELRNVGEFDKAYNLYEQIISEGTEDAETYRNLVFCKYGITYVDDYDNTKKPTINRISMTPILEDDDYKKVLALSDSTTKAFYEEEGEKINNILTKTINATKNEKPYDIFISYKETDEYGDRTKDSVIAQDIYSALEKEGYRVFLSRVSLSSVVGKEYEPYIYSALYTAKIMILVSTNIDYINSTWVKNERTRFLQMSARDDTKTLIPCYKDIDPYDLPKEMRNLQGLDMSKLGYIQDLIIGIKKIYKPVSKESDNLKNSTKFDDPFPIRMLLSSKEFGKAIEQCDQLIERNSKNPYIFLYKLLAKNKLKDIIQIETIKDFNNTDEFKKALGYADEKLKDKLSKFTFKEYTFEIHGDELYKYLGKNSKKVIIPEGVTTIKSESFKGAYTIEEVVLPRSVKQIEFSAFIDCSKLNKINLECVESIESLAFSDCEKIDFVDLSSIKEIGSHVFSSVGLLKTSNKKIFFKNFDHNSTVAGEIDTLECKAGTFMKFSNEINNLIILNGETILPDEYIDSMNIKNIVLPETLKEIRMDLTDDSVEELESLTIKAENIKITAEYFCKVKNLKNFMEALLFAIA